MTDGKVRVTVACAEPGRQTVLRLALPPGRTVWEAVLASGIFARHPAISMDTCGVGIYGIEVARDRVIADGDRVELLRPLPEDPKERRRRLAREGRSMRSAGGG